MTLRTILLSCFCIVIAALVAFVSLGKRTIRSHEAFVAVTAREMMINNEYIIPTFNNESRLNKTPLPYWLVIVAQHFTGRIDEFTARMPSAILAVLSVVCILYFVTFLLDFNTAFLSAMLWTCSLGFIRYSHNARPEMHLTFFMITCFLSFYAALEATDRKKQIVYSLIFWISLGLSLLAKAPSSLIFMALAAIIHLTLFNQWKDFKNTLPVWGFALFLLIVLPWPIAAANAMHWDLSLWKQESIGKFAGADINERSNQWYYYLPRMFLFCVPWSAFIPFALAAPFAKAWGNKRKVMSYLGVCLFAGIAFLSVCSGKRQHYILPLIPLAAILTGIVLEDMIFKKHVFNKDKDLNLLKWHAIAFFLFGLMVTVIAFAPVYNRIANLISSHKAMLPDYSAIPALALFMTGILLMLSVITTIYFALHRYPTLSCLFMLGGVAGAIAFMVSLSPIINDGSRLMAQIGSDLKDNIPVNQELLFCGKPDEEIVHYFGRPIKIVSEEDVQMHYNNNEWLVVSTKKSGENIKTDHFDIFRTYQDEHSHEILIIHKQ